MSDSTQTRLQQLEMLYSDQEYTIQSLSDTIARQDRELGRLQQELERLKQQLQSVKSGIAGEIDPANEKPPHY